MCSERAFGLSQRDMSTDQHSTIHFDASLWLGYTSSYSALYDVQSKTAGHRQTTGGSEDDRPVQTVRVPALSFRRREMR